MSLAGLKRIAETVETRALMALVACALAACGILEPNRSDRVLWHVPGRGWGIPAVDDARGYYLGDNHDVIAVDKATGAVVWRQTTGIGGGLTGGRGTLVVGNLVLVGDWDIHAFDRATGARHMTFSPAVGYSPGLFQFSTDGQYVYAGSPSGHAYAFDPAALTVRWVTTIASDNNTSVFNPVYDAGVVYACVTHFTNPQSGGVVALSAETGAVLWTLPMPAAGGYAGGCYGEVVLIGSRGFAATNDGRIHMFDKVTGVERRVIPRLSDLPVTGGSPDYDLRPLVKAGTMLVAGSTTGYLAAYDGTTGAELWRRTAAWGAAIYPLASDGSRVYAVHVGFQLAAFRASDGRLEWATRNDPGFVYTPAVDGERLYIGGTSGFYALRK